MATDSRIDRLEAKVDEISQRVTSLDNSMNARFAEVSSRLNTLMVVNIGLWATTIGALVGLFLGTR